MSRERGDDAGPEKLGHASYGLSWEEPLLFERSRPGRVGYSLPDPDVPVADPEAVFEAGFLRDDLPALPELSEVDVVRHFTRISTWNAAVDLGFYPLGSCTMKYNPKINEWAARLPGFAQIHPLQPVATAQGMLELCWRLEQALAEVSGMDRVTPAARRRRAGRTHRHHDDPRLPRTPRREAPHRAGARLGTRHQPGERGAERLPGRDDSLRPRRHPRTRKPSRTQ